MCGIVGTLNLTAAAEPVRETALRQMLAMIRQESLFDPDARSSAGALGLAQIMPDTGRWIASQIGETDYADSRLLRPYVNLRYSAWYYELLLNLYDRDWMAALVAQRERAALPGSREVTVELGRTLI